MELVINYLFLEALVRYFAYVRTLLFA